MNLKEAFDQKEVPQYGNIAGNMQNNTAGNTQNTIL